MCGMRFPYPIPDYYIYTRSDESLHHEGQHQYQSDLFISTTYKKLIRSGIQDLCKRSNDCDNLWFKITNVFDLVKDLGCFLFGSKTYDYEQMRSTCNYGLGVNISQETCQWFWSVCDEMTIDDQIKIYKYITGCQVFGPRITIKLVSLAESKGKIKLCKWYKHKSLLLPMYETRELLQQNLYKVIQNQTHS